MTRRALIGLLSAAAASGAAPKGRLRIVDTRGEKSAFFFGDHPLFEYRYSPAVPKPYVYPLYAPNGAVLGADAPPDHKHHRGLQLGWSNVNGYDFWGEPGTTRGPYGQIIHQRFENIREKSGVLTATNHWLAGDRLLLVERRTLRAYPPGGGLLHLGWDSELKAVETEVVLKAHQNRFDGLGIRFIRSMTGGNTVNSAGSTTIERVSGQRAEWCAYSGTLASGGVAGVAIFDHPSNPRHSTPFFVMNGRFGYLSAAPTFYEPLRVERGTTIRLRYRILTFLGEAEPAKLDSLFAAWKSFRI